MSQTLVLTEADQGVSRVAAVGQDVTVRLGENPTTGYRWALTAEPAEAVEVSGSEYAPGGSAPGAAGEREFHLGLKGAGTVRLHLKLWREWQGDGSVVERREFLLQVGPGQ